jgi:hypothetical protein
MHHPPRSSAKAKDPAPPLQSPAFAGMTVISAPVQIEPGKL